jgi:TPR repeat protein
MTLARWFREKYFYRESDDLSEAIKWYTRAIDQGHSVFAASELAFAYRFARAAPWFDTKRSFALLQFCAPYRNAFCLFWLARAYQDGAGTARDYAKAYAYYTVAKELGWKDPGENLQKLDTALQSDIKTNGAEQAKTILAGLKPIPRVIRLQIPETQNADPSPSPDPTPQPAIP